MRTRLRAIGLTALLYMTPAMAMDKVVLTTLEWPPYTGRSLPENGASAAIVSAAFAREGISVSYVFLPWNRAMEAARNGGSAGFFPAYKRPSDPRWVVSDEIGTGPLYFAERADRPVRWRTLDDLRSTLIGVNAGFVNTKEIDARLSDGRLHGDTGFSDEENLRKLARGRVDLVLIDGGVFGYLSQRPDLQPTTKVLRLQDQPLEQKALFVDFRNDDEGRILCDLLNRGLAFVRPAPPGEDRVAGQ